MNDATDARAYRKSFFNLALLLAVVVALLYLAFSSDLNAEKMQEIQNFHFHLVPTAYHLIRT